MDAIYQVQSDHAFGYSKSLRKWVAIDTQLPTNILCDQYHVFEVGLESLGNLYTFTSTDYLADIQNRTTPLQTYFNEKAGIALSLLTAGLPTLTFNNAHYQSLNANIGPEAYLCPPNYHYTQDFSLDDANDIVLLGGENTELLRTNAFYHVCGMFVPHTADISGVRLIGGGAIAKRNTVPDIGCVFLNDVGTVKTVLMRDCAMTKLVEDKDYYSSLLFTLPESVENTTIGYVIGGILHWLPKQNYYGDKTVTLALPNFSVIKTLLETRDFYDWDAIGVGDISTPTAVEKLQSSETLKALLSHDSSFFIIIDNPYIEIESIGLQHAASYGRFHLRDPNDIDGTKPLGMLRNDFGRCISYWPTWEEGEWTFHTQELSRVNYLFSHAKWKQQHNVTDAVPVHAYTPYRHVNVTMERIRARKK